MMQPTRQSGFTLLEVVLTIAIMSVLMGGLTSAVLIATHAAPDKESVYTHQLESERVAQAILGELQTALWITELTGKSLRFTIPDRNGDSVPEWIRYQWADDRLDRTYNGTTATVLSDLTDFTLFVRKGAVAETYEGPLQVLAERLLSLGYGTRNLGEYGIGTDTLMAELFDPNFAGVFDPNVAFDERTWRPTRVRLRLRSDGTADGIAEVSLTGTRLNAPHTTYLTTTVSEASLPNKTAWQEVRFNGVVDLPAYETYAITINSAASSKDTAMQVEYRNVGFSPGQFLVGDSGGWRTSTSTKRMQHQVYGHPVQPGPDVTVQRSYLREVGLTLQTGDDAASAVSSATHLRNLPEELLGWWQADFDSSPLLDHNGDGQADWYDLGGGHLSQSVSGGVWNVDSTLQTQPDLAFNKLTTVEVDLETTSPGAGAFVLVPIDAGDAYSAIGLMVGREWDNTQTLQLQTQTGDASWSVLSKQSGLELGALAVRLVIDPASQSVRLQISGVDHGTFAYTQFSTLSPVGGVRIGTSGASARFHAISVRSGS